MGHQEIVEALIQELGADRHPVTKLGKTALHLACAGGHTELVSTLWQIFDLEVNATDNDGRTPLHHAVDGAMRIQWRS